jgi:hypothetical protein
MATFVEFLSTLNSAKQQSIFWHNQTTSYSTHKALNCFYDDILGKLDTLVESTAGIYGRPVDYTVIEPTNWTSTENTIVYFQNLYKYVESARGELYKESWIQNQIDEISSLIAQTIYKLTLNK